MGHKIFVSYKYADCNVACLPEEVLPKKERSSRIVFTVRDYVNVLEAKIDRSHSIYKGEHDGNDLSDWTEDQIKEYLSDKIRDSSVTILLISPNMYNTTFPQKKQWIPWEIYVSLKRKRITKDYKKRSLKNALLGVVLPDENGNYEYAKTMMQFDIINMNYRLGYMKTVNWDRFMNNMNYHIESAIEAQSHIKPWVKI